MGIERVLNQVGPVVGRQMLMLGKRLTAQEAQAANLIDEVVEKDRRKLDDESVSATGKMWSGSAGTY